MTWFQLQISEIDRSLELRIYGILLALIHCLTHYSWSGGDLPIRYFLATTSNTVPICWPFLQSCSGWKVLTESQVMIAGWVFAGCSLLCAIAFGLKKTRFAWSLLVGLTVFRLAVYAQDYRFTSEFQYMTTLVVVGFLFLPAKTRFLKYLIIGFYLSAAFFHLKQDWFITDLVPDFVFRGGLLRWLKTHDLWIWGAAYSLILTSVFVWGLLSKNRIIFWIVLIQFVLYHLVTQSFLGWPSTLMMLLLLLIFPLSAIFGTRDPKLSPAGWFYLLVFALMQIIPLFGGSNKILTGETRYGAITMFDNNRKCQSVVLADSESQTLDLTKEDSAGSQWMECDPYNVFQRLKNLCPALASETGFKSLTWRMMSQINSESSPKLIVSLDNVCDSRSRYNWYGRNTWIKQ